MTATKQGAETLKEKALHETQRYLVYAVYLALVFATFNNYRRLVLKEYEIVYLNWGYSVIEALVLAKVVLIGEAFKLGERRKDEPLIPTLYKSLLFALWSSSPSWRSWSLGRFTTRIRRRSPSRPVSRGRDEIIARLLMMFVAFVPFFAFVELRRALGLDTPSHLSFRRRAPAPAALTSGVAAHERASRQDRTRVARRRVQHRGRRASPDVVFFRLPRLLRWRASADRSSGVRRRRALRGGLRGRPLLRGARRCHRGVSPFHAVHRCHLSARRVLR